MADQRQVIWTADCPPSIYTVQVTLDDAAWAHAIDGHPEVEPHQNAVKAAIQNPTAVYHSNTHPNSIVFMNGAVKNPDGHVLTVPVRVKGFKGFVATVYFRPPAYPGKPIWKA